MFKHRKENRPQPHAVGRSAERSSEQAGDLQPAQRRDHAEGEQRGERQQRKEHIQTAASDRRAKAPAQSAQHIEHERERGAEKPCRQHGPRLRGNGHTHPKRREKKPPPAAGSAA